LVKVLPGRSKFRLTSIYLRCAKLLRASGRSSVNKLACKSRYSRFLRLAISSGIDVILFWKRINFFKFDKVNTKLGISLSSL